MTPTATTIEPGISASAPAAAPAPASAPPPIRPTGTEQHTQTESSLAPTSEFMRYVLAAWSSRYLFRGLFGTLLDKPTIAKGEAANAWWVKANHWVSTPGRLLQKRFPHTTLESKEALTYNAALGVGSLALTLSYSGMVYKDIKNIFSDVVAAEFDKDPKDVTFQDISRSDNKIIQQTINNFWSKLAQRAGVDLLFFPAAWMRNQSLGDLGLGLIGGQMFLDTWKRKPTMFEDLVTFTNNKINPRNGLGQQVSVGEVFDLYQHYNDRFHPEVMFSNVIERSSDESRQWSQSQPIFQRITELMNQTYAYKHTSQLDAETGEPIHQADFPLPKFIFMLGHDLIDTRQPEQTLTLLEIANRQGIPAVKQALGMIAQHQPLEQVRQHFHVTLPTSAAKTNGNDEKNGVLARGSTMQLDAAPVTKIDVESIAHELPAQALQRA